MFIHISRRSSSLGAPFLSFKPPRGPGTSISQGACCWQFLFFQDPFLPEGIKEGLTEIQREEALRENSGCTSEELMFIF